MEKERIKRLQKSIKGLRYRNANKDKIRRNIIELIELKYKNNPNK